MDIQRIRAEVREAATTFGWVEVHPTVVKASHQRYLAGETQKALAKELRVHPSVLCDAFQGKIWRGVV